MLFCSFFVLSRTWLFLKCFADNKIFPLAAQSLLQMFPVSTEQQLCLASVSPRHLLVSFHLGKYHSDKQITFQKLPEESMNVIVSLSHSVQELVFILMFLSPGIKIYKGSINCEKKQ